MYLKTYSTFLRKKLKISKPLKIVCDPSNGSSGFVLKEVFKNHPKIKLILINEKVDGNFPAHGPNPLASGAIDQAVKEVLKQKADLGAVFDADGDRVFFIDEKGQSVPSFATASLLFKNSKPPFVADEIVFQSLRQLRSVPVKNLFPSKIGTYFIKEKMKEKTASVAAEYSGHFYFKDFFGADSGIMALIKICNFLSSSEISFSKNLENTEKFETLMENLPINNKKFSKKRLLEKFTLKGSLKKEKRDGLTLVFKNGFVNIRPSNTEPLLRITSGAISKKICREFLNRAKLVKI